MRIHIFDKIKMSVTRADVKNVLFARISSMNRESTSGKYYIGCRTLGKSAWVDWRFRSRFRIRGNARTAGYVPIIPQVFIFGRK